MNLPDVDIDMPDREALLGVIDHIKASQFVETKKDIVPHNTGIYLQNIPVDFVSGCASFPYDVAEELGYFKIDLIPYGIYNDVASREDLVEMVEIAESPDFPYELFLDERFFQGNNRLTHLGNYLELCKQYPPKSVMDVAILISLIRPAKKHLIGEKWETICNDVWIKTDDYGFKKSHAIGYALAVMVHLQILIGST